MITVYVAFAVVGLVLILISGISGALEAHVPEIDTVVPDHGSGLDLGYVPFLSLRFWTYFAAGFGLVGSIFTYLKMASSGTILTAALLSGAIMGFAVHALMRYAKKHESGSVPTTTELIGAQGKMVVGSDGNNIGKARVLLHGETLDVLAIHPQNQPLRQGDQVLILSVTNAIAHVENISPILENELK